MHLQREVALKLAERASAPRSARNRRSVRAVTWAIALGATVALLAESGLAATDGTHTWNVGSTDPKTGQPLAKGDPRIGQPIGEREFARRKSIMQRQGYYEGGDA